MPYKKIFFIMIFFIFCISIFLPYLNRKNCNDSDIGYTCKDLEDGINKLQELLKRKRNYQISYHTFSKNYYSQIIIRIYTVALALATDSIPKIALQSMDKLFFEDKKESKIPFINPPSFANIVNKIKNTNNFFPICFNESSLTKNMIFQSEMPPVVKPLLLNPSIYRLTEYLGPAAYHILTHFALNFTSLSELSKKNDDDKSAEKPPFISNNFRNKSGFAILSPMPFNASCVIEYINGNNSNLAIENKDKSKIIALDDKSTFESLFSMMNVEHFGYQIGDMQGVVITLLRGVPSFIYDPVSNTCYKGRSIISGALNPIYSGIYRSNSDLSRGGSEFCHNPDITKNLLKKLL